MGTRFLLSTLLLVCVGCSGPSTGTGNDPLNNDPTNNNPTNNPPNESCGVNPIQSSGDTADVAADGTVIFKPIAVGQSATFAMPAKESADTDETLVSVRATGAFQVVSSFPMYVPKGETVHIDVVFAPTAAGETTGELTLDTAKMGSMHVALKGTGL